MKLNRFARTALSIALILALTTGCSSTRTPKATDMGGYGFDYSMEELAKGINNTIHFQYDSSVLNAESKEILDKQIEWLKDHRKHNISIEGHCDERGTRSYNLALGERRASAVKEYMVSSGIPAARVTVISYGKDQPNPRYPRKGPKESGYEEYLAHNRYAMTTLR